MDVTVIDNAAETFRAAEKALYRGDGQPRYAPEEHAERRAALFAVFDTACETADNAASKVIADAEQALLGIEHDDPTGRLSADDLTSANAKRAFVAEDAERLPLGDLAARCTVALVAGDTATIFLLARYARKRGEAVLADLHNGTRMSEGDRAALRDLDGVLKQLDGALADPTAANKRAKAEEAIKAARAVKAHTAAVHGELSGAQERTMQRMRAQYGL